MKLGHDLNEGRRTQDIRIKANVNFERFLLKPYILEGLKECGFLTPSPIQYQAIPLTSCGFDMLLEAKAGTGKTVVFCVRALQLFDVTKGIQAIILAPTREIAVQICDVIKQIGSQCEDLHVAVVMGGLPLQDDIDNLKNNVHIVVGSPGRLHHLIRDGHLNVTTVKLLVIDEADKLMEKSFKTDIDYIFCALPKEKQVIMSSATYPEESMSLIKTYVPSAHHVRPESNSILLGVNQTITTVIHNFNVVAQTQIKFQELTKILSTKNFKQCLIFCNYQARVVALHKLLVRNNWPAELLHGGQKQPNRLVALKSLHEYKCRILISTDLAARGLDSSNLDLVINFETPQDWQTYLHRIGRAGRFGQYGDAITIVSNGEEEINFHKVIDPIKESIDLRELWSGNIVSGEIHDECLTEINDSGADVTDGPINNMHLEVDEKLWDAIASQDEDTAITCESLSELQNSLDKFNTKDDTDCPPSNENTQSDANLSIQSFLDHIYKIENKIKEDFVQCTNGTKESTGSKLKLSKGRKEKAKELDSAEIPTGNQTGSNEDNDTAATGNEYWNTYAALINAGLPTSFASKRNKNMKMKYSNEKNVEKNIAESGIENLDANETLTHQEFTSEKNKNTAKVVSKKNKNKGKSSPILVNENLDINDAMRVPKSKKEQKSSTNDARAVHFKPTILRKYQKDYSNLVQHIKQKKLKNAKDLIDDARFVFSSEYYHDKSDDDNDDVGNAIDYDIWLSKLKFNTNYIERELYRQMYVTSKF